jgi:TIR domain
MAENGLKGLLAVKISHPNLVFISYKRVDRDWAEWIAGAIESAGYEPVIKARHFRPGENFVLRMQEAAVQTDFTIAVLSETHLESEGSGAKFIKCMFCLARDFADF